MKTLNKYFVITLIGLMSLLTLDAGSLWAQGTPVQVRSGSAGAIGNGVITPLGNTTDPKCSATDSTQEGAICLLKQTIFQLANVLAQLQATLSIAGTVQPGNTPNTTPWLFTPNDGAGHSMPMGDASARTIHETVDNASLPVTESGTWTMQPGNTANTTPWLMTTPFQFPCVDKSGSITTGGTAQTAAASNSSRQNITVQNYSTATTEGIGTAESLFYSFSGTATLSSGVPAAGVFELPPGKSVTFGATVSTQALSVNAVTTGHKWAACEQ